MAELFENLTEEAIRCRAARFHDWRPETAARVVGGWESWETCGRGCGCRRYTVRGNTGRVMRRSVQYPAGYLMPKGHRLEAEDRDKLDLMVFHWDFDPVMGRPAPKKTTRRRAS